MMKKNTANSFFAIFRPFGLPSPTTELLDILFSIGTREYHQFTNRHTSTRCTRHSLSNSMYVAGKHRFEDTAVYKYCDLDLIFQGQPICCQ